MQTVICGVKQHIIKLKAFLNSLKYNTFNKPQIIVSNAFETPQYNERSTNGTSKVMFYYEGHCSLQEEIDPWDPGLEKETTNAAAFEMWGSLVQNSS